MKRSLIFLIISTYIICCTCSFNDEIGNDDAWSPLDYDLFDEGQIEGKHSIKVAALVPETGDASFLGKVVKAGFEKAVKDRKELCYGKNQKCQVPTVYFADTKSSPRKALELFQKCYSRGIRIFIGLVTSEEAELVAKYASKHARDAILFSPTSTATILCKYKNLRRMTMDDRGYAEVLFDLSIHFKKEDSTLSIQVIHRNDVHGKGLYNDIAKRYGQASKEGYKILSPISYDVGNNFARSNLHQLIQTLANSPIKKEKHSLIVLIGLSTEAELILREAAKHSSLKRHTWILSDALTLSNVKIPHDMNVLGLSFVGDEGASKLLNKERRGLNQYLNDKNLPPMTQAQLAYDVITYVLQNAKGTSDTTIEIEGLTGPLEFSVCGERTTGSYIFATSPKQQEIDNLLRKVILQKWVAISHFSVESSDRSSNEMSTTFEDYSPEARMQVELESTSKKGVSSVASPSVEIKKSELLKQLVEVSDETCTKNARLIVQSYDGLSQKPIRITYTVANMPESLVFSLRYGFIMTATCQTGQNYSLSLTRVCPSTKIGGSEIICQTRTSSTAIGRVSAEGRACTGTSIATGVCYAGVFGCFAASFFTAFFTSGWCVAAKLGCGSLHSVSKHTCRRGKFVCTELFRQGYLPSDIMLADMSFAGHYGENNPITRKGYDILGPPIASWMSSSKTVTDLAKSIAIPWAEEMAYHEGYRDEGNEFGATVMSVGSVVCGLVGGVYMYSYYIIGGIVLTAAVLVAQKAARMKSYAPLAKKIN